ncbi:PspA/IM30 family protein [Pelagicoccus sp. NFK12]|uniref:PspA/IM30 family protein n=1 Tax=Pelagicoccus enzymogenes TaxID=2773457 RepID=A0A927F6I6_9BACT|nr:PspA/IM30 family protein [Pelagicoccus enzymogenes]MBD5778146.1 PspA/IM30 family protein [Pelagicoccus enzymogenes]
MRKLKIWTASIVSGFDSVISKVENHESLVASSIQELQTAAAHATVKLGRLKQEIRRMKDKRCQLEQSRERWKERALALRESDKAKAIECLRRGKSVESEIAQLEKEIPSHNQLADSIEADLRKLQNKIDELKLRKRAFSTRASRAKAMKICQDYSATSGEQLEDTFERWELKLAESEIASSACTDSLEDEFLREEEFAALEEELEQLEPSLENKTAHQA